MEPPSQHPLEPQLQAWAETRRLQCSSPFELHSADRHQLQQEVQRTHQNPAPASTRPAWRLLLPRLALIAALTCACVLALIRWFPDTSPATKLAQNSQPAETVPALPALEKASELPVMGVTALNSQPPRSATFDALLPQQLPETPAPAPAPAEIAPAMDPERRLSAASKPVSRKPEAAATISPISNAMQPAQDSLAIAQSTVTASKAKGTTQPLPAPDWTASFRRQQVVARRNLNAPSYPVLQSFQVEQRGDALQMIDADGSVYRGDASAEPPTASPLNNALAQNYRFKVSGTHQSSQRFVQFEGVLENTIPPQIQGRAALDQRDRIVIRASSSPQR